MSQYPIPQFIEEEGKIIFFLTFRQFFLLAGGGAVCLIIYFLAPYSLFLGAAALIMITVIVIAFVKVQNASIVTVVLNMLGFMVGKKNYTWSKRGTNARPETERKQEFKKPVEVPAPKLQPSKLRAAQKMIEVRK
ncbi:MAG: hypothetical protein A3A98_00325 [Candidatus Staskawiczbacteria bacterium RIFCSPLOWO2_01_FULL_40_39]|uniref:PrgI family protein n=1 Tax=Candidatus Staskawiczbacteria bacterium RIFCSPHIGHO2_01_FULL_39_25 TaxID=1802202 RepID=A0A1G2HMG6_9BACT|nr:MAG: hypothetical protein A2730_00325 [Candidatus Staskawiczbacteria bacterium RIFCSPHIGHO2_01_FULL_39_25]OGZ73181.1 MAG: hypothetical protein A3A98_00325 [Candidatus Staskawiczbacteria bacterium RIFCSPLOWO2_01_FULL_40_39]OGZ76001.1 MAG: hypothetical protein A3I87_01505 [Candidatus Staskawiczbacteria bacterium RIFCSPLOWO2_02_FULL_39_8]